MIKCMILDDQMYDSWWSNAWCLMIKCIMLADQMHYLLHQASSSVIKHYQWLSSIIKCHQVSSSIIKHHQASSSVSKIFVLFTAVILIPSYLDLYLLVFKTFEKLWFCYFQCQYYLGKFDFANRESLSLKTEIICLVLPATKMLMLGGNLYCIVPYCTKLYSTAAKFGLKIFVWNFGWIRTYSLVSRCFWLT